MRRLTAFISCLMVVGFSVAADEPDPSAKKADPPPPQIETKDNGKAKPKAGSKAKGTGKVVAGSRTAAVSGRAKPASSVDPRATSLFRSAQNLEKTGKKPGAIALYRDLLIKYPESPEAPDATARLGALGGKIPAPSEIKPAPPPEKPNFTRVPKPKYASQNANRDAVNQALGGLIDSAASQPAAGASGGYGK